MPHVNANYLSGRSITGQDVTFIRELIAAHPENHRAGLSRQLCQAWTGAAKRPIKGYDLPQPAIAPGPGRAYYPSSSDTMPPNPFLNRRPPAPVEIDSSPIVSSVKNSVPAISLRRSGGQRMKSYSIPWSSNITTWIRQPVGEHLKYIAFVESGRSPASRFARRPLGWAGAISSSAGP